uniref:Uncharacterized protein n=1 Tax=Ascaris lumbricoides TaxID=6252 RepID=A0A0M3IJR2_ASCLU
MTSTLVETVNINLEDFSESFLTCATCLCTYDQRVLESWIGRWRGVRYIHRISACLKAGLEGGVVCVISTELGDRNSNVRELRLRECQDAPYEHIFVKLIETIHGAEFLPEMFSSG